uniref:Uncharacterized protein n=1 Tax=Eutreptiella gymnastica TaxID=73025 RepID=A0A7S1I2M7_9EUGL
MATPKRGLPAWNMLQCDGNMMTLKRSLHSSVVYEDAMYVFGGSSNKSVGVNQYSFAERRWETHAPVGAAPECLWGHTAITWNGGMFIFGGCSQDGRTSNRIYCFDLASKQWSEVHACDSVMPLSRSGHSALLLEGTSTMLVFGGEHQPNHPLLNDLWLFDFSTCKWQQPSWNGLVPRGRKHHTAVQFEKNVYVFGGTDSRATFNDFHAYDIEGRQWHAHEGGGFPPTERFGHVAVVHNRRMHVFGGLETVQMYSNAAGSSMIYPFSAGGSSGTGLGNGHSGSHAQLSQPKTNSIYFLNDWYKFSFKYGTWIRLSPNGHIPSGRWGHTALEHKGKLFILGGANHKGCLNDMYAISLSSLSDNVLSDLSSGKLVSCSSELRDDIWDTSSATATGSGARGEKRGLGNVYAPEGDSTEDGAMDMDQRDPAHAPPPRRSLAVRRQAQG